MHDHCGVGRFSFPYILGGKVPVYIALLYFAVSVQCAGVSDVIFLAGRWDGWPERYRRPDAHVVERRERKAFGGGDRACACDHCAARGVYRGGDENG